MYICKTYFYITSTSAYLHQLLAVSPVLRATVHCSIFVSTSVFDRQFGAKARYSVIQNL